MKAKYLLRLDDACEMMNHQKWQRMEALLDKHNVKPMVAVIPLNKDKAFNDSPLDRDIFWDKVKSWQKKGWEIAQHGYTHEYVTKSSGDFTVGNKYSEFAGLLYSIQEEKISKGHSVFIEQGIEVNSWIAPAHTFDTDTVRALKEKTKISIISDGIALFPYEKEGFTWVPVQVANFRKFLFGYWTVCLHPNEFEEKDFVRLEKGLEKFKKEIITVDEIKPYNDFFHLFLNQIFRISFNLAIRYKRKFYPNPKKKTTG